MKNAVITEATTSPIITIGSTVRLEKEGAENKMSHLYTIVGSEESDTAQGKISNISPLGSALIGHKEGDTVKVQTPKGTITYKVAALA